MKTTWPALIAALLAATSILAADAAPSDTVAAPTGETSTWLERIEAVHPALGLGVTVRGGITGKLAPGSLTWDDGRWELFLAYFRDQRRGGLTLNRYPAHIGLAPPMWALTASRRFQFIERPRFRAFAGIGIAYLDTHPCTSSAAQNDRTPVLDYYETVYRGCDKLNGSRLNYALQLGARLYSADHGMGLEFAYRHFSNAGLTFTNLGEDLVTAMLVF